MPENPDLSEPPVISFFQSFISLSNGGLCMCVLGAGEETERDKKTFQES